MSSNLSKNRYECDVCKRVFTRLLSLNEHKYIHTNSKPFECIKCEKTFRQSSNFNKHQKLHQNKSQTNGKSIVCKVCGRVFGSQSYLKSHLLSHNNTKTCLCHKCGNSFKYRSDLMRHLKIHDNSRQYKCHICQNGFNDSSTLKRHQIKVHQNQRQSANDCNESNDQLIGNTSSSDSHQNSFDNTLRETNYNNNSIGVNESDRRTYASIEFNGSNQLSTDLNETNYLNSVIDYINVCRILPQPLPSHIFEKVVDLQKEIALHLGIDKKCRTDHYNILRVGLQDLNAIVCEHLQNYYKNY